MDCGGRGKLGRSGRKEDFVGVFLGFVGGFYRVEVCFVIKFIEVLFVFIFWFGNLG